MDNKIPNDKLMWDIWMSRYYLATVTVADELGLFKQLKNNSLRASTLAKRLEITERYAELLGGILVELGFLRRVGLKIGLNPTAKNYLLPDSPCYWGAQLQGLRERSEHKQIFAAVTESKCQLSFEGKDFTTMWEEGAITIEAARDFTQKMHATIFAPALGAVKTGAFKNIHRLLDMGGGSGCFTTAFLQKYPKATATVFELPSVAKITEGYLKKFKLTKRTTLYLGNFFKDPWPPDHDGLLLSQIFHDWPYSVCEQLAQQAYNSLPKGGHIFIHEMLLNKQRSGPLTTLCFDLLMLINHRSQQFTQLELAQLLRKVGFKSIKTLPTFGYYSLVIGKK